MKAALRRAAPTVSADEWAIARTIIYASLFDYPLTLGQVCESLLESSQTEASVLALYEASRWLQEAVEYEAGLFFPTGRRDLIAIRSAREQFSLEFLARHRKILAVIASMPFVRMVAVSGSLAHLNLDRRGDLDLFVITRGRRVWSVTVAIVLAAKLLGCRRTVCANYVMSDARLALAERDLFTANQIVHLKPVAGADMLRAFVAANPFVGDYYPNYAAPRAAETPFASQAATALKRAAEWVLAIPSLVAEPICRRAYASYLRRRADSWQSPRQVTLDPDRVKLHTRSHRAPVLARFEAAVASALGSDTGPLR